MSEWREKRRREERPPSESRFSHTSAWSVKRYASSTNSVKERKRLMEGAKLEMQVLKEKQELQRELERVKKGKAELNRKLELLDAKTKVQQTEMDLMLEQTVERETDGMNDYLKEYYKQNDVKEEVLPQLGDSGTRPSLESKPGDNRVTVSDEQLPTCGFQSQLLSSSAQVSVGTGSVITFPSVPCMAQAVSLGSSASFTSTRHMECRSSLGSVTQHSPYPSEHLHLTRLSRHCTPLLAYHR